MLLAKDSLIPSEAKVVRTAMIANARDISPHCNTEISLTISTRQPRDSARKLMLPIMVVIVPFVTVKMADLR